MNFQIQGQYVSIIYSGGQQWSGTLVFMSYFPVAPGQIGETFDLIQQGSYVFYSISEATNLSILRREKYKTNWSKVK